MECKICVKAYCQSSKPQALSCGHSLCENCLNKLKSQDTSIKCPFDRLLIEYSNPNYQLMQRIGITTELTTIPKFSQILIEENLCPLQHLLILSEGNNSIRIKCNDCYKIYKTSS